MHRTVFAKGGVGKPYDVYSSRELARKVQNPRDGKVGFAVIGRRVTPVVWSGRLQMWMPPGIAIQTASSTAHPSLASAA